MSFALLQFGDHVGGLASPVGVNNYIHGDEPLQNLYRRGPYLAREVDILSLFRY